jgi:preprotein translocase SecE subunit
MNRALRRQQVKDKPGNAPSRAMPRTGAPRPTAREAVRGGNPFWRPRFLMDVISELRKVVWPKREDVINLTIVIVIVTIAVGAVLGGIDFLFGWLVDEYLLSR